MGSVTAPHAPLVTEYLHYIATQRKLAPRSVLAYSRDLATLQALAKNLATTTRPAPGLPELAPHDFRGFLVRLHAKGWHAHTLAHALSAWRQFYAYLCKFQGLQANPVHGLKAPKAAPSLPKALSGEQMQGLLETRSLASVTLPEEPRPAGVSDVLALRDQAMFELLYTAGLRVGELVGIDVVQRAESLGWLNLRESEVSVIGKGSKKRTVPLGAPACAALEAWIAVRAELAQAAENALFVGTRGARASAGAVQLALKARARAAGTQANVHPHVLRHSFASHLLQNSGDLRAVQELLGHSSLRSTQVYTHLDFQALAKVYDAAHPRARRTRSPISTEVPPKENTS